MILKEIKKEIKLKDTSIYHVSYKASLSVEPLLLFDKINGYNKDYDLNIYYYFLMMKKNMKECLVELDISLG